MKRYNTKQDKIIQEMAQIANAFGHPKLTKREAKILKRRLYELQVEFGVPEPDKSLLN